MIKKSKVAPIMTMVKVLGTGMSMEIDTGASVSIISETTWKAYWSNQQLPLRQTDIKLTTNTGEPVVIWGEVCMVEVDAQNDHTAKLPLVVVSGEGRVF